MDKAERIAVGATLVLSWVGAWAVGVMAASILGWPHPVIGGLLVAGGWVVGGAWYLHVVTNPGKGGRP